MLPIALIAAGCGPPEIDTTPGRSRGVSINGTGAFASLLRERGHEVRAAVRTTETLADWANVIVRFSLHPGRPEADEGRWFDRWLQARPGRKLVYVVLDYDAEPEFWDALLRAEPKDARPEALDRIKRRRDRSKSWVGTLPPRPKQEAARTDWFTFEPKPPPPSECQTLGGPWAEGIDAEAAAVSKHELFQVEGGEQELLTGDGSALAISWTFGNGSQILALANGSFLVNASLLNQARRPLTLRVADWIGTGTPPLHVAFVEGSRPTVEAEDADSQSPFRLFRVPPFDWISAHLLGFGFLLALSQAVRLGRPSPQAPSGVERPSAHPEALGALLAKTGQVETARFLIESYRRWRHPAHASARKAPASPPSRRVFRS